MSKHLIGEPFVTIRLREEHEGHVMVFLDNPLSKTRALDIIYIDIGGNREKLEEGIRESAGLIATTLMNVAQSMIKDE